GARNAWPLTGDSHPLDPPGKRALRRSRCCIAIARAFLLSALARSRAGFASGALVTSGLRTALRGLAGTTEVVTNGLFFSWLLWRTGSLSLDWLRIVSYTNDVGGERLWK